MVDENSTPGDQVAHAEREMYGPIAEAHALCHIRRTADAEDDDLATLAFPILERMMECFETYQRLVALHGRLPTPGLGGQGAQPLGQQTDLS